MVDGGLDAELQAGLDERARRGLARRTTLDGPLPGVDFGSNDYLGLAGDPGIAAAMTAALEHGVGGRSARLLAGGSPLHERCEAALAEWVGAEAALLFARVNEKRLSEENNRYRERCEELSTQLLEAATPAAPVATAKPPRVPDASAQADHEDRVLNLFLTDGKTLSERHANRA